jgi:putative DNA primase/helicase
MNNTTQFINAIAQTGITPPHNIIDDGLIHRFCSNGKPNDTSGWYSYHSDGIAAGSFGCWRSDVNQTWVANIGRKFTQTEQSANAERIKAMQLQREAEIEKNQAEAEIKANIIWDKSVACNDHVYLTNKGVKAYGLKQIDGTVVIPLRDGLKIHSIQYISIDGFKKFLYGGRIKGCYFTIGKPSDIIYIAEGYATGASIHEATGSAVVVAFNAGNLSEVAKIIRAKYPTIKLVICADDDQSGIGIRKANEAAKQVGASVVLPNFGDNRPDKVTDFNDLHKLKGLEEVKAQLTAIQAPVNDLKGVTDATPLTTYNNITVSLQCASDITPEAIRWLWNGWLARGKLHIFAGMAGTGKTTIAIALASTITTGGKFPDGSPCPIGSVLIWSGEDSPADTLVPRLMAAGADLSKVHFVGDTTANFEKRSFDPATDMQPLMFQAASITNLALLIIDPIVNAVAGDSHKNGEVRRALQPVVEFGEKLNCAVLGITHFSKGGQGKDPLERVTGSLAFGALARIVLATAKIVDGENSKRIVCRAKSNIGIDTGGFEYDLHEKEVANGIFQSYALWGDAVDGSALQLLAEPDSRESGENGNSALEDAKDFLQALLADGELSQKQIKIDANGAGHSWRTVERAKKELNIRSNKSLLDKGWYWKLNGNSANDDQLRQERHITYTAVLADLTEIEHIPPKISTYEHNDQIARF